MSTFNGLHGLTEEEQTHLNTCLLPLHANLAAALYQLKDYPKAIDNARKVCPACFLEHSVLLNPLCTRAVLCATGAVDRFKAREGSVQTGPCP
jgi:hypothetical protein